MNKVFPFAGRFFFALILPFQLPDLSVLNWQARILAILISRYTFTALLDPN